MASETEQERLVDEHIARVIAEAEHEDKSPPPQESLGKDSTFLWLLAGITIALAGIMFWALFAEDEPPKTIDELHMLNLEGKLPEEQGYVINGFSFVKYDNFWYTQLKGKKSQLEIFMRYGPRDVEDITIIGNLSRAFYENSTIFVTFDPYESDLKYHAVTIGDLSRALYGAFGATPVAACTREHPDCAEEDIITCDNATSPTIFVTNKEPTLIALKQNCIQIQGKEFEMTRAADRLLLSWYDVI